MHLSVDSFQESSLVKKLDGYSDAPRGFEHCFAVRDTLFDSLWKTDKDYLIGADVPEEWSEEEIS